MTQAILYANWRDKVIYDADGPSHSAADGR